MSGSMDILLLFGKQHRGNCVYEAENKTTLETIYGSRFILRRREHVPIEIERFVCSTQSFSKSPPQYSLLNRFYGIDIRGQKRFLFHKPIVSGQVDLFHNIYESWRTFLAKNPSAFHRETGETFPIAHLCLQGTAISNDRKAWPGS
jgi:hypothetical protein